MDVRRPPHRTTAGRVRIANASRESVVTHDAAGEQQAYLRTAIGWRRDTGRLHGDDLVTDPALSALLDAAAADRAL